MAVLGGSITRIALGQFNRNWFRRPSPPPWGTDTSGGTFSSQVPPHPIPVPVAGRCAKGPLLLPGACSDWRRPRPPPQGSPPFPLEICMALMLRAVACRAPQVSRRVPLSPRFMLAGVGACVGTPLGVDGLSDSQRPQGSQQNEYQRRADPRGRRRADPRGRACVWRYLAFAIRSRRPCRRA